MEDFFDQRKQLAKSRVMLEEANIRLQNIHEAVKRSASTDEVQQYTNETKDLQEKRSQLESGIERLEMLIGIAEGTIPGTVIATAPSYDRGVTRNMEIDNNQNQLRSFQKFVTAGFKNLAEEEKRALDISGAGAVLPTLIADKLITNEKYSDLLFRSTVINEGGAGSIRIPIASGTKGSWKIENSDVDGSSVSYEAAPTLTYLELKGFELMRLMTMSAATSSMASTSFTDYMLNLLSAEVIETLEESFITGTGTGQPKGLSKLTFTTGTNQVLTASAATAIAPTNIASAISLMPQKYARNAVV